MPNRNHLIAEDIRDRELFNNNDDDSVDSNRENFQNNSDKTKKLIEKLTKDHKGINLTDNEMMRKTQEIFDTRIFESDTEEEDDQYDTTKEKNIEIRSEIKSNIINAEDNDTVLLAAKQDIKSDLNTNVTNHSINTCTPKGLEQDISASNNSLISDNNTAIENLENQNKKSFAEKLVISDEELNKYLAKSVKLDNPEIKKDNDEFLEKLSLSKTSKNIPLDKTQEEILKHIDRKMFPKTFESEICAFINQQMSKFNIINNGLPCSNYIPIFAPDCLRIKDDDSIFTKICKLKAFKNVNVHYIITHKSFVADKYQMNITNKVKEIKEQNYLFGCPHKIEDTDALSVFVFLNSNIFNEKMEVNTKLFEYLAELPLCFMFFSEFYKYDQFMFGLYQFVTDAQINKKNICYTDYAVCNHKLLDQQRCKEKCTIKTFNEFKKRINKKIKETRNFHFQDNNGYICTLIRKRPAKKNSQSSLLNENAKVQKLDIDLNQSKYQAVKSLYSRYKTESKEEFNKKLTYIDLVLDTKYKEAIQNDTYDLIDLYSEDFNESIFISFFDINKVNQIRKNVLEDLNKLNLNKHNNLVKPRNTAFVLLHEKYNIYQLSNKDLEQQKINSLINARVKRYHTASMFRTNQQHIYLDVDNTKIAVALTTEIENIQDNTKDHIFLFLPEGFDNQCKPLFDPNKLAICPYFYNKVEDYSADVGYPLYIFYTHPKINIGKREFDYYYGAFTPDIDKLEFADYIRKTYEIFNYRAFERAKQAQNLTRNIHG